MTAIGLSSSKNSTGGHHEIQDCTYGPCQSFRGCVDCEHEHVTVRSSFGPWMLPCPIRGKVVIHGQRNGCRRRTQDRGGDIYPRRSWKSDKWRSHCELE